MIRSLFFDLCFYLFTIFYLGLLFPFLFVFKRNLAIRIYKGWAVVTVFLMSKILRLEIKVEGIDHYKEVVKSGPVIIACQHQSALDTIIPPLIFDNFSIVVKKELSMIPVFRQYLKFLEAIILNRSESITSIKNLLIQSKKQFEKGRNIFIFPQGHRAHPNECLPSKPGVFMLYKHLNCSVLPVSLNTGFFWTRKAFLKKGGTITIKILPVIEKNLDKKTFLSELDKHYETFA